MKKFAALSWTRFEENSIRKTALVPQDLGGSEDAPGPNPLPEPRRHAVHRTPKLELGPPLSGRVARVPAVLQIWVLQLSTLGARLLLLSGCWGCCGDIDVEMEVAKLFLNSQVSLSKSRFLSLLVYSRNSMQALVQVKCTQSIPILKITLSRIPEHSPIGHQKKTMYYPTPSRANCSPWWRKGRAVWEGRSKGVKSGIEWVSEWMGSGSKMCNKKLYKVRVLRLGPAVLHLCRFEGQ